MFQNDENISVTQRRATQPSKNDSDRGSAVYIRKHKDTLLPQGLPWKLQIFLAKISGVKVRPNDSVVPSLILYIWLLIFSLSYASMRFWYVLRFSLQSGSQITVATEWFSLSIILIWCSMGMYSQRLIFYIISSPSVLSHVRRHSRSFLKIPASILIVILVALFLAFNLRRHFTDPNVMNCTQNNLPMWFCYTNLSLIILYSVPALFLNIAVFMMLLSIMRTNTIIIRRQICDFENDDKKQKKLITMKRQFQKDLFVLPELTMTTETIDEYSWQNATIDTIADEEELRSNNFDFDGGDYQRADSNVDMIEKRTYSDVTPAQIVCNQDEIDRLEKLLISTDELNYRYRTLFQRTAIISLFFQRWVLAWLLFVVIWTVSYIIFWLKYSLSNWDAVLLVLPIIKFWLMCSSYAEVNHESLNFLRSIYPTIDRLPFLRYIAGAPIQVGVFQVALTYTVMLSIFAAMGVAITSKIIIDAINKHN